MTILPLSLVHVRLLSQQQIEPALLSNPDKTDQEEGIPTHVQQIRTYHQYTEEQTCQIPHSPQDYTGHIPVYICMYICMLQCHHASCTKFTPSPLCSAIHLSQQVYIWTLVDCKEWTTYNLPHFSRKNCAKS